MEYTDGLNPAGEDEEPAALIPPLPNPWPLAAAEAAAGGSPAVPAAMARYSPPWTGNCGGDGRRGEHGGEQGSVSHYMVRDIPLSSRSPAAPSDPRRKALRTQAAEQFIITVERKFANKGDKYLEFQGVLLQYFFGSIDKRGVVNHMQVVLHGYPDLIRGFNAFMPRGYELKIEDNQQGGGAGDA